MEFGLLLMMGVPLRGRPSIIINNNPNVITSQRDIPPTCIGVMKIPIQPIDESTNKFVDMIMCEYANGEAYLYPLKPNYETALLECRVAMESGRYSCFTFFRASFPDETLQALNCLTPEKEHGPSQEVKSIAPLPLELKKVIWQIAATKGIFPKQMS